MEGKKMNDLVARMHELMRELGVTERLEKKNSVSQFITNKDGIRVAVRHETPLREIPGIMADARANEKRNLQPTEEDDSPETR